MTLEEYLELFEENHIAIQITLDIGKQPTVHALYPKDSLERKSLKMTEADTLLEALEQMKVKLFG